MAAGLGFKTFTTGEVLTAADVNGYLMQGILVFATEAARNSAITSPQEGQFAFTKDNNSLWYYTGSAWVASGATGDIEGVTAGVGISGGGTSGTVTITNDMATTITASGDIVVGTGNGTYDNLPIGTTGQILTADTTVSPYKVKWASAASSSPASNYAWSGTTTSTTSTSYVTATTNVTVTTGTKAMVSIAGNLETSSSISDKAFLAFAVSGATTRASSDNDAAMCSLNNSGKQTTSRTVLVTGLTAGSNTFTLQIRTDNASATAGVDDKSIFVMDMGS